MRFSLYLFFSLLLILECDSAFGQSKQQREIIRKQQEKMHVQQMMVRMMNVIHNKELREELEIVDEQVEELKSVIIDFQKDMQKANADHGEDMIQVQELIRKGKHKEAMEMSRKFQDKMIDISKKHFEKVEQQLLPHQVKRIKQVTRQEILKYSSGFKDEFGIPLAIADDLELTESEIKKLRTATTKAREKYYAEIVNLKEKAHAEIMKAIPAGKRGKVKEIVGDFNDEIQNKLKSEKAAKRR